jgi:hypothetical protein
LFKIFDDDDDDVIINLRSSSVSRQNSVQKLSKVSLPAESAPAPTPFDCFHNASDEEEAENEVDADSENAKTEAFRGKINGLLTNVVGGKDDSADPGADPGADINTDADGVF